MKLHANAALSLRQRERMVRRVVEQGWSITKAAMAAEVSEQTCSKWVGRYRQDGLAGLVDRSSTPQLVANRTGELIHIDVKKLGRIETVRPSVCRSRLLVLVGESVSEVDLQGAEGGCPAV